MRVVDNAVIVVDNADGDVKIIIIPKEINSRLAVKAICSDCMCLIGKFKFIC